MNAGQCCLIFLLRFGLVVGILLWYVDVCFTSIYCVFACVAAPPRVISQPNYLIRATGSLRIRVFTRSRPWFIFSWASASTANNFVFLLNNKALKKLELMGFIFRFKFLASRLTCLGLRA